VIAEYREFSQRRFARREAVNDRIDVTCLARYVVATEQDDIGSSSDQLIDEGREQRRMGRRSGVKIGGECNHQRCRQPLFGRDLDFLRRNTEFAV
jgi:hypothetical protein